uniref:Cytochrome c oxidase subunit 2 n=1 Tax=Pholcus sp. HCP-2014 TaxID=1519082 RepID=A0A0U1V1A1_9ARAC|nr:cytochrome c oxidase subunit II [Pholcus sp. HCP-2014]
MPVWGLLYFQESVSPVMEQLIFFHDHTMVVMVVVMVLVGYMLFNFMAQSFYSKGVGGGQEIETVWTVLPIMVLLVIAFPSLRLLYMMEESIDADLTVSVMGHQWYWSYELPDIGVEEYDSYLINSGFRLLEVDKSLALPVSSNIRVIVSSSDVIHSWTVPSVGVSADAVPGRLNQMNLFFNRVGWYSGQCSEICGANHSFMPIFISVMGWSDF